MQLQSLTCQQGKIRKTTMDEAQLNTDPTPYMRRRQTLELIGRLLCLHAKCLGGFGKKVPNRLGGDEAHACKQQGAGHATRKA